MANGNRGGKKPTKAQKQAAAYARKNPTVIIVIAVLLLVIAAAFIIFYLLKPEVFNRIRDEYSEYVRTLYGDSNDDDPEGYVSKKSDPVPEGEFASITEAEFSIHFLELGNKYAGDCTLIKCGDTEVLIDAGSRTSSAATINAYVDQFCGDKKLEYVIATHAHQDHIAGFVGKGSGNNKDGVLYTYEIGTVIQFSGHNTSSGIYTSYVNAVTYAQSKGAQVFTALDCWNGGNAAEGARRSFSLNDGGTLTLNVLYNYYYDHKTEDENDYSVCVLLSNKAKDGTSSHYLFTGDLEGKGEEYLVDNNDLPQVKLFKGGHHGSKTSSTDKLLNVIKPENVAVCCCAGATEYTTNADNTFPTQAFIDRISKHTENVYCTSLCGVEADYKAGRFSSMNGNIVFYVSDKDMRLWCSNNTVKLKDTEWFKANRRGWGMTGNK